MDLVISSDRNHERQKAIDFMIKSDGWEQGGPIELLHGTALFKYLFRHGTGADGHGVNNTNVIH
jgi:hypothetical protein